MAAGGLGRYWRMWRTWRTMARGLLCALALTPLALMTVASPAAAGTDASAAAVEVRHRLVKAPAREQVWLVRDGRRHWIADLATFHARGYRWDDVEAVAPAVLYGFPLGPADHAGPLLRDASSGEIYLVADGQARPVPDLVSFVAYGLQWDRVQPAERAALDRQPRGPALLHAVTGRPLPALPALVRAPGATAAGGVQRSGAPGAGAAVDPRLSAALRLMESFPPTAAWPRFLADYGVTLRFGPAPSAHASYRAEDRTLTISDQHAGLTPGALATLLVHETVHAIYDAGRTTGKIGRACIDEEAAAFAAEAAFWAHLHGPGGIASPSNAVEEAHNRVLRAALDDALTGMVITTWAYTIGCYFPGLGTGSLEE